MVIVAAIKVKNEKAFGGYTVIPCWRHHLGYSILHELCPETNLNAEAEEGFINHRGEFLNRTDAFHHAMECGQISAELRYIKAQKHEDMLFSEDLY